MVFLRAGLLEQLMFQSTLCLLCMKQLRQAEVRGTHQKVEFTCPALAFCYGGSRSGPPSPDCLHSCNCGSTLRFPLHPSSAASGLRAAAPWPELSAPSARRRSSAGSEGLWFRGRGATGAGTPPGRQEGRHGGWKEPARSRCSLAKPS